MPSPERSSLDEFLRPMETALLRATDILSWVLGGAPLHFIRSGNGAIAASARVLQVLHLCAFLYYLYMDMQKTAQRVAVDQAKSSYSPSAYDFLEVYSWWGTVSAIVTQVTLMSTEPLHLRTSLAELCRPDKRRRCLSACRLFLSLFLILSFIFTFVGAIDFNLQSRNGDLTNNLKIFHTNYPSLLVEHWYLEACWLAATNLQELKGDPGQRGVAREAAFRERRFRHLHYNQLLKEAHYSLQTPLGMALFLDFVHILLAGYRLVGVSRGPTEQLAARASILAAPAALKFARIWSVCRGVTALQNEQFELNITTEKVSLNNSQSGVSISEEYHFKKQLQQMKMDMRIFGMFSPNNEFLFKVLATVATYVMVFYQFSVSPQDNTISKNISSSNTSPSI